jgi:hypothetical protein
MEQKAGLDYRADHFTIGHGKQSDSSMTEGWLFSEIVEMSMTWLIDFHTFPISSCPHVGVLALCSARLRVYPKQPPPTFQLLT